MPNETDSAYPEYLFNKQKSVYSLIPSTFDAFMYYTFPSLQGKITYWDGFDIISINFIIQQNNYFIIFHYFKRLDGFQVRPQLLFTKNFNHELYQNYFNNGFYNQDYFKINYEINGIKYKLSLIHGDDIHLFKRRFSIFNQLFKFLVRRFNHSYFKRDSQIIPSESL
jgi:hypothetical protein